MSDISFIKSKRGGNLVQHENFLFRIERKREDLSYWRCSTDSKCPARIVLYKNTFKSFSGFHTHEPATKEIQRRTFSSTLKERAIAEITVPVPTIYKEEMARTASSYEDTSSLPNFKISEKIMYRARSSVRPPSRGTKKDINSSKSCKKTKEGEDILLADDGDEESGMLPITCKAAVVWNVGEPYKIETVVVDVPKKDEVRVRMTSAGVCHSDLHTQEGINKDHYFPSILGHEGAGIIESVGEGVTSLQPGDKVVLLFEAYCGECSYCKDTRTNLCQKQPRDNFQMDGTSRITCQGKKVSQMSSLSTFSEYTVTSIHNVTKVNQTADASTLCLAGCCIPSGYGAAMNAAKVRSGASCAIWGLGGVGMCVAMGCRDSGASKIIGVDTNPRKFSLAKDFGCTEFVNPTEEEDISKKLAEMTNGGVDYCFVSVGAISAMEEAVRSSHPAWGTTVIIGLANYGETMRVGVWDLIYGKKLIGTHYGSYKAKLEIPSLVEKVVNGEIQLEKLISHKLPLEKINEGFNMLKTGESLRAVIDFSCKA